MSEELTGHCLCKQVGFSADTPSLWCGHCHCSLCRRAHGAAFVTWVGIKQQSFRITSGQDQLRWYSSSSDSERGFCPTCGSTLFFRSPRWPGEVHVVLAAFDGPIDRQPQAHGYWETHVDWVTLGDDLPRRRSDDQSG